MAAHTGHTAATLLGAADLRSHASARRARHRLTPITSTQHPATAPATATPWEGRHVVAPIRFL
eukprot:scaffold30907_cov31-Phaeocystis_antarctica.AAC.1